MKITNIYKNKYFKFLCPIPSICLILIFGFVFMHSEIDGQKVALFDWFGMMIIFFIFFVIPFDVIYWCAKKIIKFLMGKNNRLLINRPSSNNNQTQNRGHLGFRYVNPPIDSENSEDSKAKDQNFDSMDGHRFEHYCADLLKKNGFKNVEVTRGSGDHGIDILAEKDDISYAIQTKCYTGNIGNAAIQQAHTGKSIYKKDIAVVLTNRDFTPQAKEEAEMLGVKLWDREKLLSLIDIANS